MIKDVSNSRKLFLLGKELEQRDSVHALQSGMRKS